MTATRPILSLALIAGVAFAIPGGATAAADRAGPGAHAAGGDVAPLNPAVIAVPIKRAEKAMDAAADAIERGQGATAAGPLKASRRNLIRAYRGAKFLIANAPPPEPEDARAASRKYVRLAHRFIRSARVGGTAARRWVRAQPSQDDAPGPTFADAPTAVFSVLANQYDAATASVGMLPDTTGNLLARVDKTLSTAIVLRNRLVKIVAAAAPPAPPDDARVRAAQDEDATTFDLVMPGLAVLLADEIQQMQATVQDTTVPAASSAVVTDALAADNQIMTNVNTLWPPVVDD